MPLYEYRCEGCGKEFEQVQPVSYRAEDTVCPFCHALKATKLMSSFASKVIGDHKTGFKEMKAYDMLNQRMDKFSKLPPPMGKRVMPSPENFGPPASPDPKKSGT